jgi:D-methionine transport system ATP-binding protein
MPAEPPAIDVRAVTKRFAQGALPALDKVSLHVSEGEIHGVLGLSGAGKTTLLRCIARLELPDSGKILISGSDWTSLTAAELRSERGKMGILFQQLHLLSSRTVSANISLPLELSGTPRAAKDYPSQLSGGQRQRVALARALASNPRVLLADEPASALDAETRASVLNTLRSIREQFGVTIPIITHDLHSAATICDMITVLDAGRVAESGQRGRYLSLRRPGLHNGSWRVRLRLKAEPRRFIERTSRRSASHEQPAGTRPRFERSKSACS